MPDIRRYTLHQVEAYLGAIERARKRDEIRRRRTLAIDLRMAQAEGPAWRRYMARILDGGEE